MPLDPLPGATRSFRESRDRPEIPELCKDYVLGSRGLDPDTSALLKRICNECCRARGLQNIVAIEIVRIRISCFLSGNNADADAEIDAFRSALDDLLLEDDGVINSVLEIEVCVITTSRQSLGQICFEIAGRDVVFLEEDRTYCSFIDFPSSATGPTTTSV